MGGFKPFLWFHLLLRDPGFHQFFLPSHSFPSIPFPKPLLSASWLGGGLALCIFKHLNKIQVSRTGQSPCRQVLLCPLLSSLWYWKETELLPPSGLDESSSCQPHWSLTSFTQAEMSLNLDVFPLSNTWLLIQSPLVWSTAFNFGSVDSDLATWDLHPEQANTLAYTYPWHRTGLAQTELYQSWLHCCTDSEPQQPHSLLGHFISDSTFLILLLYYVCKGVKFSNPLSTLISVHSRFYECNFKLEFMKEISIPFLVHHIQKLWHYPSGSEVQMRV